MNSIFSSFDALSAEFMCQSFSFFNIKNPASTIQDDQKKVTHETNKNTNCHRSKREYSGGRWAPELDGLHCFENIISKLTPLDILKKKYQILMKNERLEAVKPIQLRRPASTGNTLAPVTVDVGVLGGIMRHLLLIILNGRNRILGVKETQRLAHESCR
ncbi:unnamed protein product [Lactuca saligna]|uniref:Uncharacterized protein n=1 Tax=Lactuca saligna TaxID=75948 RepID=A0AA35ZEX2_LACSI|nr:unnamed protein product [Lactuca saligna]